MVDLFLGDAPFLFLTEKKGFFAPLAHFFLSSR
jgi:hypothetical protein